MSTEQTRPKGFGLKWRPRKDRHIPYWNATKAAIAAGYRPKVVDLRYFADDPSALLQRAKRLQLEMQLWVTGDRGTGPAFNGDFKSLFEIYQTDADSPFRRSINHNTAHTYAVYIKKLIVQIGELELDRTDGRHVRRWFAEWKESWGLGAARTSLVVLKEAISFGIVCRLQGCLEFKALLGEMEFERLPSRSQAPTASQIIAVRKAAHANGAPLRALCYAIQFETSLRQWDVTGQWIPLSDPKPSLIHYGKMKWIGPMWSAIDQNLMMKIKPTKTEDSTGVEVTYDLSACPMVVEELALLGDAPRTGPLIVYHGTQRPYTHPMFRAGWREDAIAAGLPKEMQNRDLRAGSITEGGKAGASKDDRRKLAGHAKEETTDIYDRDQVEAHRRVMQARKNFREKNTP